MAILSQTVSDDLKTALANRSFDTSIQDLYAFYDGSTLYTAMTQAFSRLVAVSHQGPRKLFETGDTALVRAWDAWELLAWCLSEVQYENHAFTSVSLGTVCRCTLTVGGRDFTGDQTKGLSTQEVYELEAFGKAVIALLDDEDFNDLRN